MILIMNTSKNRNSTRNGRKKQRRTRDIMIIIPMIIILRGIILSITTAILIPEAGAGNT